LRFGGGEKPKPALWRLLEKRQSREAADEHCAEVATVSLMSLSTPFPSATGKAAMPDWTQ
jgi:hypothetical protein